MPSKPTKAKNRGAEKVAQRRTALSLTGTGGGVSNKDIDRHPERRVKAAYNAYEEKRLPEVRKEISV
ncbi:hypothetical protein FOB64_005050 [Candida albicans]|uniref:Coiled-coil domain-containing protein n=1 Tax=Candida albicans TaxID=5476 RepID=A0A8H6F2J8_CANAX|nr:hypothetical protein FOB64_005050 [Candida albicans]